MRIGSCANAMISLQYYGPFFSIHFRVYISVVAGIGQTLQMKEGLDASAKEGYHCLFYEHSTLGSRVMFICHPDNVCFLHVFFSGYTCISILIFDVEVVQSTFFLVDIFILYNYFSI